MGSAKKLAFIVLSSFMCGFVLSFTNPQYFFNQKVGTNIWSKTEVDPSFIFTKFNSNYCLEKHSQFINCINSLSQAAELLQLKPSYSGGLEVIKDNESIKNPIHSKEIKKWMIVYGKYKAEKISFADMFFTLIKKTKTEQLSSLYAAAINGFLQSEKDPHTYIVPAELDQLRQPRYSIDSKSQKNKLIVKIKNFAPETCVNLRSDLLKKLDDLENKKPSSQNAQIQDLIVDVSNNPGGKFDEVACVISMFHPPSEHIFTLKYFTSETQKYYTQGYPIYFGKLTVKINSKTASTAEIFAGTLKYLGRAQVIGSRSFGKGTFQKRSDWQNQSDVSLFQTVGVMLLPNNQVIQGQGILPNLIIPVVGESERENELFYNAFKIGDFISDIKLVKKNRG